MTDLSHAIGQRSNEDLGQYFGVKPFAIEMAVHDGAETYQDIQYFLEKIGLK